MTKLLAKVHASTESAFAHYGHVFFFFPMAFDHIGTVYGNINAAILCLYAVAAFAYRNTDA